MSENTVLNAYSRVLQKYLLQYKEGKQVYASYRYNTKVTKDSCILECLHETSHETSGKYSCEVSNAYGSDICHAQVTAVTATLLCIYIFRHEGHRDSNKPETEASVHL